MALRLGKIFCKNRSSLERGFESHPLHFAYYHPQRTAKILNSLQTHCGWNVPGERPLS